MTLADRILELPADLPPREVAKLLGCKPHYVSVTRSRAKRPEYYRELHRAGSERRHRARGGLTRAQFALVQTTWTKAEDEKLAELLPNHSYRTIARLMGKTRNQIAGRCHRLKLKKKTPAT